MRSDRKPDIKYNAREDTSMRREETRKGKEFEREPSAEMQEDGPMQDMKGIISDSTTKAFGGSDRKGISLGGSETTAEDAAFDRYTRNLLNEPEDPDAQKKTPIEPNSIPVEMNPRPPPGFSKGIVNILANLPPALHASLSPAVNDLNGLIKEEILATRSWRMNIDSGTEFILKHSGKDPSEIDAFMAKYRE
jgi:hypothetical protein